MHGPKNIKLRSLYQHIYFLNGIGRYSRSRRWLLWT